MIVFIKLLLLPEAVTDSEADKKFQISKDCKISKTVKLGYFKVIDLLTSKPPRSGYNTSNGINKIINNERSSVIVSRANVLAEVGYSTYEYFSLRKDDQILPLDDIIVF